MNTLPASKPKAADRTIDMFTGSTNTEAQQENDAPEPAKSSETIEQASERWRATAFYAAEFFSKSWDDKVTGNKYRLTVNKGMMFLETFGLRQGNAYSWSGVSFPEADLYEITSVLVKAAKAKKEKEDGKG